MSSPYVQREHGATEPDRCERCGRPIRYGTLVMLELDRVTGRMHKPGTVDPARSQGGFPFGPDCARRILRDGGEWDRVYK